MRNADRVLELGWQGESAARRADNRASSGKILADHGVAHEVKNGGAHIIVTHGEKVIDFWPGTGKFIPRGFGRPGRGVFNLLKLLGVEVNRGQ